MELHNMSFKNQKLVAISLMFVCVAAHAAKGHKVLSVEERKSITGMSATTVAYEPRQATVFGVRFLARTKEEKRNVAPLLGDPTGNVFNDSYESFFGDRPVSVSIPGVDDPARSIAAEVQQHLTTMGLTFPDSLPGSTVLPSTPLQGNFVPDTNVEQLILNGGDKDLVFSVQTYTWQISRHTAFTGVWLTYIGRMTLLDRRTKTVLLERDCSAFVRHSKSEVSSLVEYLGNDKAMLKSDLLDASAQCKANFVASLQGP